MLESLQRWLVLVVRSGVFRELLLQFSGRSDKIDILNVQLVNRRDQLEGNQQAFCIW